MKIYTKTGDNGTTSLFGGERVDKDNKRIEAYGTVDELNSVMGIAICEVNNNEIKDYLRKLQNDLFVAGSDLATPLELEKDGISVRRISKSEIQEVEKMIDHFDSRLPQLTSFILPGGSKGAAYLHQCRTVSRRAERLIVALSKSVEIGSEIVIYLNRLSDLFFVLARAENYSRGIEDVKWKK